MFFFRIHKKIWVSEFFMYIYIYIYMYTHTEFSASEIILICLCAALEKCILIINLKHSLYFFGCNNCVFLLLSLFPGFSQ